VEAGRQFPLPQMGGDANLPEQVTKPILFRSINTLVHKRIFSGMTLDAKIAY
jgi:hypothetical protein